MLRILKARLFQNTVWGLLSTALQTLFLSILFILVARGYRTEEFANFLIATTIYQFVLGFSSFGLGNWFVREYGLEKKEKVIYEYFQVQALLGLVFYIVNVIVVTIVYQDLPIIFLSCIIGANILFDNIQNAFRTINIALERQRVTAIVTIVDSLLRLCSGLLIILTDSSIYIFSTVFVLVRLSSVLLMTCLERGHFKLSELTSTRLTRGEIANHLFSNWKFLVIVGISIIYWRSATIIISKILTKTDVANYEVAYKVYSVFVLFVLVTTTTLYPRLVKAAGNGELSNKAGVFRTYSILYTTYSILCFSCITAFSSKIIWFLFGSEFSSAALTLDYLMLTILFFPTVLLQAYTLVSMKMERLDMYCNLASLALFFLGCVAGFIYVKSLLVIPISIFTSFFFFHFIQSFFLIKIRVMTWSQVFRFYLVVAFLVLLFHNNLGIENIVKLAISIVVAAVVSIPLALSWKVQNGNVKVLQTQI